MTAADYLMLISMVCIWALMAINVFLSVGGFLYYHQCSKTDGHVPIDEYPFVSIMVPAHNESVVIRRTVRALLNFDYPHDRYEIIVISDNSTDDTANVLKQIQAANPDRNLIVVNTDNVVGGKGKSNALNIGYSVAKGSVFAIYDADNTPEPQALRILVENLMSDSSLGAVIGKFRTRNRNASLLTRFVNIETLAHQCMNQAGRWFYFGLCTIPGTNFVMHRHIIEEIGGWDPDALSEDTEISFRIYRMGYKIKLIASAELNEDSKADVRVHPMLVPKTKTLAHIDYVTNAVSLSGHPVGDVTLSGPGAGEFPTASSVVGDILAIASEIDKTDYLLPMMRCNHHENAVMTPIEDTRNKYYISITAHNRLGVIGRIGKACEDHNISLASIVQKEVAGDNAAKITVITEICKEKDMQNVINI